MSEFHKERLALNEERREQTKRLASLASSAQGRGKGLALEIDEYYAGIKTQIDDLIDQKHELLRSARTREDMRELAKQQLRKLRHENLVEGWLLPHLKTVQASGSFPLEIPQMKLHLMSEFESWRAGYGIITEEDIDWACDMLPEIGLTQEEKTQKVKEIEQQIAALEKKLQEDPPFIKTR